MAPIPPLSDTAKLIGIGVGPGDPELLTMKALREIKDADVVMAPTTAPGEPGRAEIAVRPFLANRRVERILFEMAPAATGVELRRRAAASAAQEIVTLLTPGRRGVFLTLGDPNMFSTFTLITDALRELDSGIEISSIPGIMAFQAVTAEGNIALLDEDEGLVLLSGLEMNSTIFTAIADSDKAIIIYKGGKNIGEIKALLQSAGRIDDAVIGVHIGMEDSVVQPLKDFPDEQATYLSTVVVPPKRKLTRPLQPSPRTPSVGYRGSESEESE